MLDEVGAPFPYREPPAVLSHLHVMALEKEHGAYTRAWEIVNDVEGKELKSATR